MPRKSWPLHRGCPSVEVWLREPLTGFTSRRVLLADTGGGARSSPIEIIVSQADIGQFGVEKDVGQVGMGGAIRGAFSIFSVEIEIPALNLSRFVDAAGVPTTNFFPGYDGFALFRFLNAFTYGNFGNPNEFGLEVA